MNKILLATLGVVAMSFAMPAAAQDYPLKGGNYWNVTEITIDDGHFGDYADFLASTARKTNEYSKSKGWIKAYYILSNVNKRASEPDLYLVTVTDHLTNVAEDEAREKDMNAFLATTSRAQGEQSGARAKFRHLGGSQLLQELLYKN